MAKRPWQSSFLLVFSGPEAASNPTAMQVGKPDFVDRSPDGSVITVLGADGFAGMLRRGVWSKQIPGVLTDPEYDCVTDPAEALNLSRAARAAMPFNP